jgi:polycystin 2
LCFCEQINKHGYGYFTKSIWNILDVLIILLSIVCGIFDLYRQIKVNSLLESLLKDSNKYVDFSFLCYWTTNFNITIGWIVFLSWIKIFKYASFNKTMTQLSLTLSRAAKDLTGFTVMFFIVFMAYVQFGYLVFGTQDGEFGTISGTM